MGLTCRALLPEADRDLLVEAWGFWDAYPAWFKEMEPRKPLVEYLAEAANEPRVSFGVFKGEELVGLIKFYEIVPGHAEISTEAKRHSVNWESVGELCYVCGMIMFEKMGYQELFAWIPAMHRANLRMAEHQGFEWDGVRHIRGAATAHGKPVIWLRMRMTRATYEDYHQYKLQKELRGER